MKMKSTMTYNQWDIILVPFPFTNLRGVKRRPALIISPDNYNRFESDLIFAFLTSNVTSSPSIGDYHLKNWKKSGLPKPTKFKLKIATILQSEVIKILGKLYAADRNKIKTILIDSINGKME